MSTLVLTNAQVLLNAQDISNHVKSVTINYKADALENTAMGATTHTKQGGLLEWTISLELYQDFAASQVDSQLFPLIGTVVAVEVRPVNGARSATNPGYNGNCLVESFQPVSGAVGQELLTKVNLVSAGALARSTS